MYPSIRIRINWAHLLAVALGLGAASAWAGATADMACLYPQQQEDGSTYCGRYELRVTITADEDVGRLGAFGVGAQLASGELSYWTQSGGWVAYRGGLAQAAEGIMQALLTSRQYLVFGGTRAELCALSGNQAFDVYAGRASIPADKEQQLQWLLSKNIPVPADHIRGAYMRQDIRNNPWKVVKVWTLPAGWCGSGSAG